MRMSHLPRCLALSVCLFIGGALGLATSSAQAATTVTVDGKQWSVSTKSFGPITDLPAELTGQEWYGSQSMALAFTDALRNQEGSFNGNFGPYFLWGARGIGGGSPLNSVYVTSWSQNDRTLEFQLSSTTIQVASSAVFAIASEVAPVPLPATGMMLVAGIGGLAALRRRNARPKTP